MKRNSSSPVGLCCIESVCDLRLSIKKIPMSKFDSFKIFTYNFGGQNAETWCFEKKKKKNL
jgi:hypothetical protein